MKNLFLGQLSLKVNLANEINNFSEIGELKNKINDKSLTLFYKYELNCTSNSKERSKSSNVVLLNGEIYNIKILSEEYRITFVNPIQAISDLFNLLSIDLFTMLNGEFCLFIWSPAIKKIYLVSDHICSRDIFYFLDEKFFVFATNIKLLLKSGAVEAGLNRNALKEIFFFKYLAGKETIFNKVSKMLPSEYLEIDSDNRVFIKKYWTSIFKNTYTKKTNDLVVKTDDMLSKAIFSRISDSEAIGLTLSGGIDSSLIACKLRDLTNKPIYSYCVGSNNSKYDEKKFSREVASLIKSNHAAIDMEDEDFRGDFEHLIWQFEQPFRFYNTFALNKIFQRIAQDKVDTLLSGNGASIFGNSELLLLDKLSYIIKNFATLVNIATRLKLLQTNKYVKLINDFATLGERNFLIFELDICSLDGKNNFNLAERLFDTKINAEEDFRNIYNLYSDSLPYSSMEKYLYLDLYAFIVPLIKRMVKLSAIYGIENREPIMDKNMIALAFTTNFKVNNKKGKDKYLFRKLLSNYMSSQFIYRKKMGFPVPLKDWLRDERKLGIYTHMLLEKKSLNRGIFNPDQLKSIVNEHLSGTRDYGKIIWAVLGIEFWHRVFIDKDYNFS